VKANIEQTSDLTLLGNPSTLESYLVYLETLRSQTDALSHSIGRHAISRTTVLLPWPNFCISFIVELTLFFFDAYCGISSKNDCVH
jgi:hypothetical protein